ncbi:hypothetical protein CCMA1212_003941 [Trichoderma ghanense]|uniref:Uncharacterized protein n=1 Tax=Trichoderma ghanense TaxID=65468 RepID=A0ABY2H8A0_9HYPO
MIVHPHLRHDINAASRVEEPPLESAEVYVLYPTYYASLHEKQVGQDVNNSIKMATQSDTSQRNKGRQASNMGQEKRNPRFAQFPKAPVKPSSRNHRQGTTCESILPPQEEEEPPAQNGGEAIYHERKPGMVRFVRNSHIYPKPTMKPSTRERRTPAVPLPNSVPPAEDKARQRRRRVSQQIHTAQRPRATKKAFKPQLSITLPSVEPGPRPSKQWNRVRSILPATRVPAARVAAVRFPISRESSPEEEQDSAPSPSVAPAAMYVCFLCRSALQGGGGLCGACKGEYAMPSGGLEDDGVGLDDEKSAICRPSRSYSSSIYSESSSVYSLDATPVDDDALAVSHVSVDDAGGSASLVFPSPTVGKACVSETGMQAMHSSQLDKRDTDGEDLYDLDWAEYYFNDEHFAQVKGGWSYSPS